MGEVQIGYQEKILHCEGGLALEQAAHGSSQGINSAGVEEAFV